MAMEFLLFNLSELYSSNLPLNLVLNTLVFKYTKKSLPRKKIY